MIPTIPFDEIGISIISIMNIYSIIYIIMIYIMVTMGLYIRDREEDQKEKVYNPDGKGYIYEWHELIPYTIAGTSFAMYFFELYEVSLWSSMFLSFMIGSIFTRTLLPIIFESASEKFKDITKIIFK